MMMILVFKWAHPNVLSSTTNAIAWFLYSFGKSIFLLSQCCQVKLCSWTAYLFQVRLNGLLHSDDVSAFKVGRVYTLSFKIACLSIAHAHSAIFRFCIFFSITHFRCASFFLILCLLDRWIDREEIERDRIEGVRDRDRETAKTCVF